MKRTTLIKRVLSYDGPIGAVGRALLKAAKAAR